MSSLRLFNILIATALAGAAGAQAPESPDQTTLPAAAPGGDASPAFATYDADKDGRITKTEATADAALASRFEGLDRNRDEALNTAEFAKFEGASMEQPEDSRVRGDRAPAPKK